MQPSGEQSGTLLFLPIPKHGCHDILKRCVYFCGLTLQSEEDSGFGSHSFWTALH
jgi:hypothetical protein